MSRILIVAATEYEAASLLKQAKRVKNSNLWTLKGSVKHHVDVLITGAGIASTIFQLTRVLMNAKYDLVINIGICGSLDPKILPVKLVQITKDQFGDFGAEDGDEYLDSFELGFMKKNVFPFKAGKLNATFSKRLKCLDAIHSAEGITVNKAHGSKKSAKKAHERFGNVMESMEGAACFYVCAMQKTKSLQIRSVSNKVERRNKKKWKTNLAIDALSGFTGLLLMELEHSL